MDYPSYSKKKDFDKFIESFDFSDKEAISNFFDENKSRFMTAHQGLYEKNFKSSAPKLRNCLIEKIHWSKRARTVFLEKMKELDTISKSAGKEKTASKSRSKKKIVPPIDISQPAPSGKFPDDDLNDDDVVQFQ